MEKEVSVGERSCIGRAGYRLSLLLLSITDQTLSGTMQPPTSVPDPLLSTLHKTRCRRSSPNPFLLFACSVPSARELSVLMSAL